MTFSRSGKLILAIDEDRGRIFDGEQFGGWMPLQSILVHVHVDEPWSPSIDIPDTIKAKAKS